MTARAFEIGRVLVKQRIEFGDKSTDDYLK